MNKVILLVEDNASDEKLTVLAFKKCGVANEIVVERDGAAALDLHLFGTDLPHVGRDPGQLPAPVVLLDLEAAEGRRPGGPAPRPRPTSARKPCRSSSSPASKEDEDILRSYLAWAPTPMRASPCPSRQFAEAAKTAGALLAAPERDFFGSAGQRRARDDRSPSRS